MRTWLRSSVVVAVGLLLVAQRAAADRALETPGVPGVALPGSANGDPPSWAGKAGTGGVVVANHPLAAEAGARMLESGGNAIDAAVAVAFAQGVVEPHTSGIGGGGFMLIYLAATDEYVALDLRERAPAAATPDMFAGMTFALASTSGISVGVPGAVRGLATALERWGTVPLAGTIAPAIRLAEEGVPVSAFLAAAAANPRTTFWPETVAIYRRPDGSPLQEGDLLVQEDLAATLRILAQDGPDAFYSGAIAEAIVAAQLRARVTGGTGRMSLDDLATYEAIEREPIVSDYRGYTLVSMPPPSSGGLAVGQMLKLVERFALGDEEAGFGFGSASTLHVMVEAMRLAFADRAFWVGDDDFVFVPSTGLLADDYLAARGTAIQLGARMATPSAGNPLPYELVAAPAVAADQGADSATTHFTVVDRRGNIVTCTATIEQLWGTGIVVPGYGFLLNNELTDFNLTPAANPTTGNPGANDVAPLKRPRSSMVPVILLRAGEPFAAFGSPGGATIINSVFQIVLNLIDHDMTIEEAVDARRISVTAAAGTIAAELGFPADAVSAVLRALGHTFASSTADIGAVNAVVLDLQTGKQYGAADARRGGAVVVLPRSRATAAAQ